MSPCISNKTIFPVIAGILTVICLIILSSFLDVDTESEHSEEEQAYVQQCFTTDCLPISSSNICATISEEVTNGTILQHVVQETCVLDDDSNEATQGLRAVCCLPNSTSTVLADTLSAFEGEFPHQATINSDGGRCGATIYNRRYLITAAHCLVNDISGEVVDASGVTATVGSNFVTGSKSSEFVYEAKLVIPHPEYGGLATSLEWQEKEAENRRIINDLALVELSRDINFGDSVKALEIAPKGFDPFQYAENAVVVGSGASDNLQGTEWLQKANFLLRKDEPCLELHSTEKANYTELQERLLCVGGIMDEEWSPVAGAGDSGGPTICRGENGTPLLCGVVSFGGDEDKTCLQNWDDESCPPSVSSEISFYHDWIQEVAGKQDEDTLYKPYLYGKVVDKLKHQHQVVISTKQQKYYCSGTLIQPDILITAASCVFDEETASEELTVSFSFETKMAKTSRVKRAVVNVERQVKESEIDDHSITDELAVILLGHSLPVSLDELPRLPKIGEKFSEAQELAFDMDGRLMSREYKLLSQSDCKNRLNLVAESLLNLTVNPSALCGMEKYSGGSICDRSSGGGLICQGKDGRAVLCGVQNFRLCMFSIPNSFVNVALQAGQIQSKIQRLSQSKVKSR